MGEELALYIIMQHANSWLESTGEPPIDWREYEDRAFEDLDYELLYDPALEGIEDPSSDIGHEHGMANLHPQSWFQPFRAGMAVHPYVADRVG